MSNKPEVILRRLLDKIAKQEEYENYQLEITQLSTAGVSCTSLLYSITMSAIDKEDLRLFGKVATLGEVFRSQLQDEDENIYVAESYAYSRLAKVFKIIQDKYKVPEEHRLMMPKYYGHDNTYLEEALVLEDLTSKGFRRHIRLECVDWKYASKSIEQLAMLHALSIAIQDEYPTEFEEAVKVCNFKMPEVREPSYEMMRQLKETALTTISGEDREKFQIYLDKTMNPDFKKEYFNPIRPVLAHLDYRKENLMHREKSNGEIEVTVLDYQCLAVGHWMRDFLTLALTATDEKFRANHFHKLIEHYYEQLCVSLRRLDRDPEVDFPRSDFDFDVKENLVHGLLSAVFFMPFVTAEPKDTIEANKEIHFDSLMTLQTGEHYKERFSGLIRDYVRWGVI